MGEIIEMKKKTNLPNLSSTESPVSGTEKLKDATAAFTFSRLPREQRIAVTLYGIIIGMSSTFDAFNPDHIRYVSTQLEPYARKDFAVRLGHLADGKA
jgi:hypothetical protein